MIAKIYGKSTKFVHHNNNLNDQYKKPKLHHMKEIIRQKTSTQKRVTESNMNTTQQINPIKIKVENSKLRSIKQSKVDRSTTQVHNTQPTLQINK